MSGVIILTTVVLHVQVGALDLLSDFRWLLVDLLFEIESSSEI